MEVDEFDFGSEDARNLNLRSESERRAFVDSFVPPRRFKLDDFYEGGKYFVYGPKGAGKTALLQYIRIKAEEELSAAAEFYFFQSSFSESELNAFKAKKRNENEEIIDDRSLVNADEAAIFWRLFFLVEAARILRRSNVIDGPASDFHKMVEISKLISQSKNVGKRYPVLKEFHIKLSKNPEIQIDGDFAEATPADLSVYLELAEEKLDSVYLEQRPIFLFVDEMEIYSHGDQRDDLRIVAIGSLVRAVRNFNERFFDSDIRIIAAIRDEVAERVSVVQGEIYRIIRDKGIKLEWNATIKSGFHPLEKMVLGRIVCQDGEFSGYRFPIDDSELEAAHKKYFPGKHSLSKCLDLTWYRPRDLALLFEEASIIDAGRSKFRQKTLREDVLKSLGERLWQDALSGLAVQYTRTELDGIDRIFRGGKPTYTRPDFIARISDLSDMYDDVAILSEIKWTKILEDLYRVGVLFTTEESTGYKNFYFRGDPPPAFSKAFTVSVHQSLRKELSIA
ncbi:hypothetical protein [uncultured Albimonas sp.]|uniref:P-loop ATPase, Sll1717 family n=1 Tax=uncultured Albimonas sp. TaxID=1331701 RepID=UPI0030EB2D8C